MSPVCGIFFSLPHQIVKNTVYLFVVAVQCSSIAHKGGLSFLLLSASMIYARLLLQQKPLKEVDLAPHNDPRLKSEIHIKHHTPGCLLAVMVINRPGVAGAVL